MTSLKAILRLKRFEVSQSSTLQKVERNVEGLPLAINGDSFRSGIDQFALEFAPVMDGRAGSHVDYASYKSLEMLALAERSVQSG